MRTRLYFTSESHIHSAFNVLRWGHLFLRTLLPQAHRALEEIARVRVRARVRARVRVRTRVRARVRVRVRVLLQG